MVNVQFGDILQLETAFRASVIFTFSGDYDADIFLGSPIMAEALNRMLAAIQEYWLAAGDPRKAEGWRDLYVVSNAKRHNYERRVDHYVLCASPPAVGDDDTPRATRLAAGHRCSISVR